jgi:dihydropteroate synthase
MSAESSHAHPGSDAEDRGSRFAELLAGWRAGGRTSTPLIMGIVNVTPDSFSDGGQFLQAEQAIAHGRRLAASGAAILDIGGESTRAQAMPVSAQDEIGRVVPVVAGLASTDAVLSVDTMKPEVATAALQAGAHVVNDIRGLQGDPHLAEVAARFGAGVVVMHNPGLLGSAQPLPGDPVRACLDFFDRSLEVARRAGIIGDRIALDPGFGFGKSLEQNLELLARLPELAVLGLPILVGTSRKSFIGKITGRPEAADRLLGTLATNIAAALAGAAIVRVHDVPEHGEALAMAAAIRAASPAGAAR